MNINLVLTPAFLILLQELNAPSAFADGDGSYFYIMCALILNHAVQFIAMRKLMILVPHRTHTFTGRKSDIFGKSISSQGDLDED